MARAAYNALYNQLTFYCPGCNKYHTLQLGPGKWRYNGNTALPSVRPTIMYRTGNYADPQWPADPTDVICHSFILAGQIRYFGDTTHFLSGETVDLPKIA